MQYPVCKFSALPSLAAISALGEVNRTADVYLSALTSMDGSLLSRTEANDAETNYSKAEGSAREAGVPRGYIERGFLGSLL